MLGLGWIEVAGKGRENYIERSDYSRKIILHLFEGNIMIKALGVSLNVSKGYSCPFRQHGYILLMIGSPKESFCVT